jgi:hypothetical protein
MVSFEEMIGNMQLADKFLALTKLMNMDEFQAWVFKNTHYTFQNGLIFVAGSVMFWGLLFMILHFAILKPIMGGSLFYKKMTENEKMFYASYYHGILHAIVSSILSLYCFAFADGQPQTTWFHCNFYKLHMFDIQIYSNCLSVAYLIWDAILCSFIAKNDGIMV